MPKEPQKKKGYSTRKKKKTHQSICAIPIQLHASSSSFNKQTGDDFYTWVNDKWLSSTKIPPYETDYSVSEEAEHCIFEKSKEIIESPSAPQMIKDLRESQTDKNSVEFLKSVLKTLDCIRNEEDVFLHFAQLCKSSFTSIFKIKYTIEPDKTVRMSIDVNCPGLHYSYYENPETVKKYKEFLKDLEKTFEIENLSKIYILEKNMTMKANFTSNDTDYKIKGDRLERKFPKVPWQLWFDTLGVKGWRKMTLYYTSPSWIRFIGKTVREVPIMYWKVYLAKCYIMSSLRYLPSPYSDIHFDFFGKFIEGQLKKDYKEQILIDVIYDLMRDSFSKLFWKHIDQPELVPEIRKFTESLLESAKHRIKTTEWLRPETRDAAIQKVSAMLIETVRPRVWAPEPEYSIRLDTTNFLKNIFYLGEMLSATMLSRINKKYMYWEEGIYRVNAYYFNENNEMMIPYGTCIEPFYIHGNSSFAWNYGGLGCIIGHEMCHAFDKEGKEFNEKGEKKRWWSQSDNLAYNNKTKELIQLFSKQIVEGKHLDGEKTLSENIADLGGVGIALHALKDSMAERGVVNLEYIKEEYKNFFISFATSWRTKYRKEKLRRMLGVDSHSPAFLRVNLVVPHFDEWYEAFDIHSDSKLYVAPAHRIRIF